MEELSLAVERVWALGTQCSCGLITWLRYALHCLTHTHTYMHTHGQYSTSVSLNHTPFFLLLLHFVLLLLPQLLLPLNRFLISLYTISLYSCLAVNLSIWLPHDYTGATGSTRKNGWDTVYIRRHRPRVYIMAGIRQHTLTSHAHQGTSTSTSTSTLVISIVPPTFLYFSSFFVRFDSVYLSIFLPCYLSIHLDFEVIYHLMYLLVCLFFFVALLIFLLLNWFLLLLLLLFLLA